MPDVTIRRARPDDATPIARLHVAAWQATYRGIAPASACRILDLPYRHAVWVKMLAAQERTILVAESGGTIVGIGTSGAPTLPEFGSRGEINYLYVDAAYARRGIGRHLVAELAHDLRGRGFAGAALGVVEENRAAIAFYERLGGTCLGRYTDPGPHWRSENLIYVWDDLARLISAQPSSSVVMVREGGP